LVEAGIHGGEVESLEAGGGDLDGVGADEPGVLPDALEDPETPEARVPLTDVVVLPKGLHDVLQGGDKGFAEEIARASGGTWLGSAVGVAGGYSVWLGWRVGLAGACNVAELALLGFPKSVIVDYGGAHGVAEGGQPLLDVASDGVPVVGDVFEHAGVG
jgi:hypothetical protein